MSKAVQEPAVEFDAAKIETNQEGSSEARSRGRERKTERRLCHVLLVHRSQAYVLLMSTSRLLDFLLSKATHAVDSAVPNNLDV